MNVLGSNASVLLSLQKPQFSLLDAQEPFEPVPSVIMSLTWKKGTLQIIKFRDCLGAQFRFLRVFK